MKVLLKKITGIFLVIAMIVGTSIPAFAASEAQFTTEKMQAFSVSEVKALEPFVSVSDGKLMLDEENALAHGMDSNLIKGQKAYFDYINTQSDRGIVVINSDLTITDLVGADPSIVSRGHWYSCGGGRNTAVTHYWWGYARYACDCETQRMAADFNSCASVAAGVGVVGAYFGGVGALPGGLSSAYFWLVASRLDANNHGRGVYVEMTWALFFDITPQ